jgi:hypothetical protein
MRILLPDSLKQFVHGQSSTGATAVPAIAPSVSLRADGGIE